MGIDGQANTLPRGADTRREPRHQGFAAGFKQHEIIRASRLDHVYHRIDQPWRRALLGVGQPLGAHPQHNLGAHAGFEIVAEWAQVDAQAG
ncbi:hypothetical protein D3C86_1868150 [compost metagenome]